MTHVDPQAPATKQDVAMLMEQFARIDLKIDGEIDSLRSDILHQMLVLDEKRQHQFDLLAENFKDHGVRIKTLEIHTGLRAS